MSEMIKILTVNNEVEASLLEEALKENNIPYVLRNFHDTVYDGIFQMQYGWGTIESYEEYKDEINKIYEEILEGKNISPEKTPDDIAVIKEKEKDELFKILKILGIIIGGIIAISFLIKLINYIIWLLK